jgi:hypothetical protein
MSSIIDNTKIDNFIKKNLDEIPSFQIIEINATGDNIKYIDTAVQESIKACKTLIKKNGKLRNIFYKIKNNKLNKQSTNNELNNISKQVKKLISSNNYNIDTNIKKLINVRINQLLKTVIHSIIN